MGKWILVGLAGIPLILGLDFGAEYYGLVKFGFFAPRVEAVRRNTFEQSRAFNEGMAQELEQMRLDYVRGDDQTKAAIKSLILARVADYDIDSLKDPSLVSFIIRLRNGS